MNHKRILFLAASALATTASLAQALTSSLVPRQPSTAPDYYCTWNLQGYVNSYEHMRLELNEDNLFGGDYGYRVWGKKATGHQGWLNHYPQIHEDLTFVMDDSWDIPKGPGWEGESKRPHGKNYDNEYLGLLTIDTSRFPSFKGGDIGRMRGLVKAVKAKGWRGLGGWVCAQDPILLTNEYTGLDNTYENSKRWTEEQEEAYWKRRMMEAKLAGFSYWKVDWGNKDRDETFRRNLGKWGQEVAPDLIIEQSAFLDMGKHTPYYISFSQTIRSYDVNNNIAQAQTIQRLKELGDQKSAEKAGWGIINCEDEPYIAAGLGCAIGVMRHPYVGALPNGKPDVYFADYGRQSRRLKNRLNEVVRGVRWHRIALPFGHQAGQWLADTTQLSESGNGKRWQAPARVSRRLPLPQVIGAAAASAKRPYLLASLYDNGCAALAVINRNIEGEYQQQRVDVSFQPKHWNCKVGVFGYCRTLTMRYQDGLPQGRFMVYGQDLASDGKPVAVAYKKTKDGQGIVIQGKDLERLCKDNDYPYTEVEREAGKDYTDLSDPGVVLLVVEEK